MCASDFDILEVKSSTKGEAEAWCFYETSMGLSEEDPSRGVGGRLRRYLVWIGFRLIIAEFADIAPAYSPPA